MSNTINDKNTLEEHEKHVNEEIQYIDNLGNMLIEYIKNSTKYCKTEEDANDVIKSDTIKKHVDEVTNESLKRMTDLIFYMGKNNLKFTEDIQTSIIEKILSVSMVKCMHNVIFFNKEK